MSVSNRLDENNFFNTEQTPFPEVINGKIDTSQFLESSKGVVCLVDKFGKVFTPVKYDMTGNIEKLHQRYSIDQERHKYLNDMILIEKEEGGSYAIDGLLWLRRALQFIHAFFTCIIDDSQQVEKTDDLSPFLKKAYKETLEPYHGWMAQRLFGLLSRLCPSRKELLLTLALGQEINEEAILHDMGLFLVSLEANLQYEIAHMLNHVEQKLQFSKNQILTLEGPELLNDLQGPTLVVLTYTFCQPCLLVVDFVDALADPLSLTRGPPDYY